MRDYAVTFKGWNGKRDHLAIVRASNPIAARSIAERENPGWMAVSDVWPV
jgi:hypothetical protein